MSNYYFDLDLRLPKTSRLRCGILKSNRKSTWKCVRFATTEIGNALPHCRRYGITANKQLHSPSCKNSEHETPTVLGQHAWLNRVFILSCNNCEEYEFYDPIISCKTV